MIPRPILNELYAVGIVIVANIQQNFCAFHRFWTFVNNFSNPYYALEFIFPFIAAFDSVFAAQYLLCVSFGGWLTAILKWVLLEDRPYWWVHTTNYYECDPRGARPPHIIQFPQTCQTGPGSPSAHSLYSAMTLMLIISWINHYGRDHRVNFTAWEPVYFLFGFFLTSVMISRMYVASHFPHQCILGAAIGLYLAPALCENVADPVIWGPVLDEIENARIYHIMSSITTVMIAYVTVKLLESNKINPMWSMRLAIRWCSCMNTAPMASGPMFSLIQYTASMLGLACIISPELNAYRYYTDDRNLVMAIVVSYVIRKFLQCFSYYLDSVSDPSCPGGYYFQQFLLFTCKPYLYLVCLPYLATYTFRKA